MNAPEKPHAKARLDTIGKPRRRVDGRAKAIGELRFADDPLFSHVVVYGDGQKYLVAGVWLT